MVNRTESDNCKKEWITIANSVACIAVVFLHTNGCFWHFSKERYWFTANIIECVFYFAVPCFFMITGATLMDFRDRYSLPAYFDKRIRKTVIPFFSWSLIGIVYKLLLKDISVSDLNAQYIWNGIINTTIIPIYWFFPILFGVYLSIPVLSGICREHRKSIFSYAVITGFVLGGVFPLLFATVFKGYSWNVTINVAAGYLLYVLAGYLVSTNDISPQARAGFYIASLLGLIMHIVGTYVLSMKADEIISTFKGYNNAPCIMYSLGVMIWIKYNYKKISSLRIVGSLIGMISRYTLCIYLLQYFIYTSMIRVFDINTTSIFYRLGAPFVIIPIVIAITWIGRRIPFVKMIFA